MKKTPIYILFFLLAAFCGCKDDISLPDVGNDPKLVVYCFPSTQDTTWISVSQSLPVKQYRDTVHLHAVGNAAITYTVNGEARPVTSDGGGYYYVTGRQRAGDRIALTVRADGLPDASAQTTIPDTVAIASPARRTIKLYDDDWEEAREYEQMMASFTAHGQADSHFAVRVRLKYVSGHGAFYGRYGGTSPTVASFDDEYSYYLFLRDRDYEWDSVRVYRTDSTYYYPALNTESEPLLIAKTDIDDAFGFSDSYFGQMYIFDASAVTGSYTLHLNIDADRVDPYHRLDVQERMELLHLTPEYYNFLKSVNAIENSDLAHYGLSQLLPTASNVSGGLGVVGGWNVSHTEWINAHRYEE